MQYDVTIEAINDWGLVAIEATPHGLARAALSIGFSLPEGAQSVTSAAGLLHRSGRQSIVIVAERKKAYAVVGRVKDFFDEPSAIVADLSDAYEWLILSGPDVIAVLAQGVSLDLREQAWPLNQAARTLCFAVEALIIRDQSNDFRIACRASHHDYLLARLRLAAAPAQTDVLWR